jgi:two-component system, chemotaxis family, chemotaxis protein CheY
MFRALYQRKVSLVHILGAWVFAIFMPIMAAGGFGLKKRVLIVDDIADIRLLLRCLIEKENFEIVAEAADGIEAVQQYCEHLPDITIMDIDMPFKTGVQAAREILAHTSDARIIFCSGGVRSLDFAALDLGASARSLVRKPFLPDQLYQAMRG